MTREFKNSKYSGIEGINIPGEIPLQIRDITCVGIVFSSPRYLGSPMKMLLKEVIIRLTKINSLLFNIYIKKPTTGQNNAYVPVLIASI